MPARRRLNKVPAPKVYRYVCQAKDAAGEADCPMALMQNGSCRYLDGDLCESQRARRQADYEAERKGGEDDA